MGFRPCMNPPGLCIVAPKFNMDISQPHTPRSAHASTRTPSRIKAAQPRDQSIFDMAIAIRARKEQRIIRSVPTQESFVISLTLTQLPQTPHGSRRLRRAHIKAASGAEFLVNQNFPDSRSETHAFLATCFVLRFQKDRTNGSPIQMFRPPESTFVLTGSAFDSQRKGTASVLNHPLCVFLHSGLGAGHRLRTGPSRLLRLSVALPQSRDIGSLL